MPSIAINRDNGKPLVIFGTSDIAQLAKFYFETDFALKVHGFVIDDEFITESIFDGCPVVASSLVTQRFPPQEYDMFIAVSYREMNRVRSAKCEWARGLGYHLPSYVSPRATIFSTFMCGDNCFILEDNTIQPFATIGNNVFLWSGNHIGHHSVVQDDVFISSHVVVSGGVRIGRGSFIGVNATIRDHVTIGNWALIGAGAIVLSDVPNEGVVGATATPLHKLKSSQIRKI
jgi:sugar O-acyltransferase (sialic acid O-acetyltransferase NeuD family)